MILEENPRPRYRPYLDNYGNPVVVKFPKRRNPNMANTVESVTNKITGGIDPLEILAGAAGLAASSMIPPLIIKTTPVTVTDKALRIGVSVMAVLATGYIVGSIGGMGAKKRPGMRKAALIGGLSGVAITVANTLRPGTITGGRPMALPPRPAQLAPVRRVGDAQTISPSFTREGENVTLIRP